MNQRTLAGIVAVPLVVALWAAAFFLPAPFVTYSPGQTLDVLGEGDDPPFVTVEGHESYLPTSGELRMTTASVTRPETKVPLAQALSAWWDEDSTVYPHDAVYSDEEDDATNAVRSTAQMTSSIDVSIAVALGALGIDYTPNVQVGGVQAGFPAEGVLEPGDVIREVDGEPLTETGQLSDVVERVGVGGTLALTIDRQGESRDVDVGTVNEDGAARIGVQLVQGYDFPFDVNLTPPNGIGGSSAGTMFALAVYDVLTPGDLTGGLDIAGTGTISEAGEVGSIGGITQKIPGARDAGSEVFLVPAPNCEEALDAANGDMRLVAIDTFDRALSTVQALAEDVDADVMTCEDVVE